MDTNILRSWSESIFKSLQPVIDGGIFTPLTQADLHGFTISDVLLWFRDLFFRPYYNVTVVLGAIWSLIIPLLLLLLLLRFCHRNCLCFYKFVRQLQRGINAIGRRCFDRKQLVSELPNRPLTYKNKAETFRNTYATLICCFVCLVGLCAGLYYSVFESYQVQYFLNDDENSTQSYKTYKNGAILELKGFLENGMRQANISTAKWTEDFNDKLTNEMLFFVRYLANELFDRFGVYSTLDDSEAVLNKLTEVFDAMQFINKNRHIVREASNFAGRVNAIKEIMENDLKCSELEYPHECYRVFELNKKLVTNIDWNSVDFDTSTSIVSLIKQHDLDIMKLSQESHKSRLMMEKQLRKFEGDALTLIGGANILGQISKIWNSADALMKESVISLLDDLVKEQPEQKYMSQASSIWRMVSDFGWGFCLTFAIIVFITWILAISKLCFKLGAKHQSRRDKYISNLESLFANKKTSALDVDVQKMKETPDVKVESDPGSVCIYTILRIIHSILGVLLLLPCLITVVFFLTGGVLTTEVCRYLVDEKGVEIADRQIDKFIGRAWENEMTSLNLSSYLNLKRPSHVLKGFFQTCRQPNVSILVSLGMTGIFNATEFIQTPTFGKLMDSGYENVKKNFHNLNTDSMIPLQVMDYIDDGVVFVKKFIDGKNYADSIKELNKTFFNLTDFPAFIMRLERIAQSFQTLAPKRNFLKKLIPMYVSVKKEIATLRNNFEILEKHTDLSGDLRNLKTILQTAASTLRNKTLIETVLPSAYRLALNRMVSNLTVILQTDVDALEYQLFPCQQLHKAYSMSMRAICGDLRSGLGSFALSLAMTLLWYQFCFLFSWCLISTLNPPFTPEESTNC